MVFKIHQASYCIKRITHGQKTLPSLSFLSVLPLFSAPLHHRGPNRNNGQREEQRICFHFSPSSHDPGNGRERGGAAHNKKKQKAKSMQPRRRKTAGCRPQGRNPFFCACRVFFACCLYLPFLLAHTHTYTADRGGCFLKGRKTDHPMKGGGWEGVIGRARISASKSASK